VGLTFPMNGVSPALVPEAVVGRVALSISVSAFKRFAVSWPRRHRDHRCVFSVLGRARLSQKIPRSERAVLRDGGKSDRSLNCGRRSVIALLFRLIDDLIKSSGPEWLTDGYTTAMGFVHIGPRPRT